MKNLFNMVICYSPSAQPEKYKKANYSISLIDECMLNITGLAAIIPAAGFCCYFAVKLKDRFGWDDALDVWVVHGIGGVIGALMLSLFATTAVNANGADGLFVAEEFGLGASFFGKQVAVTLACFIHKK